MNGLQNVQPAPSGKCIARMTVVREVGATTIVEVFENASFHTFYWFFSQQGRRRSTKQLVRTASRNEGLRPGYAAYRMTPGLEVLAEYWRKQPGVKSVTVRVLRKRIYKKLINAAPDVLGLVKVSAGFQAKRPQAAITPAVLPKGYTPLRGRFEIMASK